MRRALLSLVLASVLTVLLALAGSSPSVAKPYPDHVSVQDKVGDAPAGIDLTSARYAISKKKARFSVRVKDLSETTFLAFEIWPLAAAWDRISVYRENGKTFGKVYFVDNEEEPTPYPRSCSGLTVTWKFAKNRVTAVVPRSCLQASRSSGAAPYEFHTFSRFGGTSGSKHDSMPKKTLDY
jgi:hypothetical protein